MTCHLCACGTEICYNCVKDTTVRCSGCGRVYTVNKKTGKLILPLEEFDVIIDTNEGSGDITT